MKNVKMWHRHRNDTDFEIVNTQDDYTMPANPQNAMLPSETIAGVVPVLSEALGRFGNFIVANNTKLQVGLAHEEAMSKIEVAKIAAKHEAEIESMQNVHQEKMKAMQQIDVVIDSADKSQSMSLEMASRILDSIDHMVDKI